MNCTKCNKEIQKNDWKWTMFGSHKNEIVEFWFCSRICRAKWIIDNTSKNDNLHCNI